MKKAPKARRAANPQAEQAAAAQVLAAAMPKVLQHPVKPAATMSAALSLKALPGATVYLIAPRPGQLKSVNGVQAMRTDGSPDAGVLMGTAGKVDRAVADFIAALGKHRHPEREAGAPAS